MSTSTTATATGKVFTRADVDASPNVEAFAGLMFEIHKAQVAGRVNANECAIWCVPISSVFLV